MLSQNGALQVTHDSLILIQRENTILKNCTTYRTRFNDPRVLMFLALC